MQGEFLFNLDDPDAGSTPYAEIFHLGTSEGLVAAYAILAGEDAIPESKSFIDFYRNENSHWRLVTTTGADFGGCSVLLAPINSASVSEKWYLAWGVTIGDNGNRLKVRLYGFDGKKVRTVWKRDELRSGQIKASANSVTLDYRLPYPSIEKVQEVLAVSSDNCLQIEQVGTRDLTPGAFACQTFARR